MHKGKTTGRRHPFASQAEGPGPDPILTPCQHLDLGVLASQEMSIKPYRLWQFVVTTLAYLHTCTWPWPERTAALSKVDTPQRAASGNIGWCEDAEAHPASSICDNTGGPPRAGTPMDSTSPPSQSSALTPRQTTPQIFPPHRVCLPESHSWQLENRNLIIMDVGLYGELVLLDLCGHNCPGATLEDNGPQHMEDEPPRLSGHPPSRVGTRGVWPWLVP